MTYHGHKWSALPHAPAGLASVSCVSSAYCMAVGQARSGKALAYRWNGRTWTWTTPYNTGAPRNELSSVTCLSASDCEAVGQHYSDSFQYPLAEHWKGRRWARQSTSGAPDGYLVGVNCMAAGKCEAVGQQETSYTVPVYGQIGPPLSLAMGLRGTRWVIQRTPNFPPSKYGGPGFSWMDTAVSCWSSGCIAAGGVFSGGGPTTSGYLQYSELWNGSSWKLRWAGFGDDDENGGAWNAIHCTSARTARRPDRGTRFPPRPTRWWTPGTARRGHNCRRRHLA